jgi:hypothetical protein
VEPTKRMQTLVWMVIVGGLAAACGEVAGSEPDAGVDAGVDAAVDVVERCTPSDSTSTPIDEDGDGALDEGCPWNVGTPHWLPALDGVAGEGRILFPNWLSPDGTRLYVTSAVGAASKIMVATRSGRDAPFGPPVDLRGTGLPNFAVVTIALSDDEREAFVAARPVATPDADTDLYRMVRAAPGGDFGELELLAQLSTEHNEEGVTLRADGLEIIYAADRVLHRALRSTPGGSFGPPVAVEGIPTTGVNSPQLSRDGRTLFFYRPPMGRPFRIFRAERADPASPVFGGVEEMAGLEPLGSLHVFHPMLAAQTRELFLASDQPWSPTRYAIWRAELCRDGACQERLIPCAGVRSPDGLHCYTRLDAMQSQPAAEAACRTAGGHLASISSAAEQALVWSIAAETAWIGAGDDRPGVPECNRRSLDSSVAYPCPWGWEDGTRWTYDAWGNAGTPLGLEPQEEGEEDCAALYAPYAGLWADLGCALMFRAVCETTLYPTW